MEKQIREILKLIGENPKREGLLKTPERVRKSYEFLFKGYKEDPTRLIQHAIFHEQCNHMIIVKDIEFYSLCEHHLLPFWGQCHFGYIPDKHICGASKIPRLIDHFARRLQQQERLTSAIAAAFIEQVKPLGVAVVIEAFHLCMMMRGVEKQNSSMTTSCMLGSFKHNGTVRAEFLDLVRQ